MSPLVWWGLLAFTVWRIYKGREFLYLQGSIIESGLGIHNGLWKRARDKYEEKTKARKEKDEKKENR